MPVPNIVVIKGRWYMTCPLCLEGWLIRYVNVTNVIACSNPALAAERNLVKCDGNSSVLPSETRWLKCGLND